MICIKFKIKDRLYEAVSLHEGGETLENLINRASKDNGGAIKGEDVVFFWENSSEWGGELMDFILITKLTGEQPKYFCKDVCHYFVYEDSDWQKWNDERHRSLISIPFYGKPPRWLCFTYPLEEQSDPKFLVIRRVK